MLFLDNYHLPNRQPPTSYLLPPTTPLECTCELLRDHHFFAALQTNNPKLCEAPIRASSSYCATARPPWNLLRTVHQTAD